MKKLTIPLLITFLLCACNPNKHLINEINVGYKNKYNISKDVRSLRLNQLFLKKYFNPKEEGDYILVQKVDDIQVSGSSSCLIAVKTPKDSVVYYSLNQELNAFDRTEIQKHSFNKIQFDFIIDKIEKKKYKELTELHNIETRELSHSGSIYVIEFDVDKKREFKLKNIVLFEEFAVSWKDSKDPEIRNLMNEN